MKIRLLRQLRKESWNKYEIRNWSDIPSCKEKPWHICTGPKTALVYHEYATKEEAIKATKLLWYEYAQKYLWNNRDKRNKNKYPW